MRTIKLMADYLSYPIWEGINGDIPPDSLPISESLTDSLLNWASDYDKTFVSYDPPSSGFESQESADKFVATGYDLLSRLKAELGPDFEIAHSIRARVKPTA
jgi:hypothetical protein